MSTVAAYSIYLSIVLCAFIASIANRRFLKPSDKYISYLLLCSMTSEIIGLYCIKRYQNNMAVYHFYSPVELFLTALYFQKRIPWLEQRKIGLYIGSLGVIVAICNIVFWQPLHTINSIFLLFEGFTIIGLSLFSFYQLALHRESIISNTHFWFTTIFLVYWSCIFSYWGMYNFFLKELSPYMKSMTYILWAINILGYMGFAVLFLGYRKIASIRE